MTNEVYSLIQEIYDTTKELDYYIWTPENEIQRALGHLYSTINKLANTVGFTLKREEDELIDEVLSCGSNPIFDEIIKRHKECHDK